MKTRQMRSISNKYKVALLQENMKNYFYDSKQKQKKNVYQ